MTTTTPQPPATTSGSTSAIDRWFHLSARGSTYGREVRGGVVTFFTLAYIVVLNPLIIGTMKDVSGKLIGGNTEVGMAIAMVAAVTALVAGVMTILMGVVGRFPIAIAAGLGLNGFLAFTLAPTMTWADAMGLVVIEGVIILILVLVGLRTAIFKAVPSAMKYAVAAGIGLFLVIIALVDAGIARPGVPLITFGIGGALWGWPILTFCIGLLVMSVLFVRKVPGAILIGIAVATIFGMIVQSVLNIGARSADNPAGWGLNIPKLPTSLGDVFGVPNLGLLGQFNLFGSFSTIGIIAASTAVFTLILTDFFDTMGTAYGLAEQAELTDEKGDIPHLQSILVVDSVAAIAGGAGSASSNTSYIESGSGIAEGARTGIASIVTGVLLLLAMFIAPLVTTVPWEAAAPALILVGFLMATQMKRIDFTDYTIGIPAFLTIVIMPFTYSIANGIGAGFISYAILMAVTGKAKKVGWLMWIIAALFLVYFMQSPISGWLGLGS